jgi:hypothetical protein
VWLGYCWHQSSIRSCFVVVLPVSVGFTSLPLTTQPLLVAPGGFGHGSLSAPAEPHRGALPSMGPSNV